MNPTNKYLLVRFSSGIGIWIRRLSQTSGFLCLFLFVNGSRQADTSMIWAVGGAQLGVAGMWAVGETSIIPAEQMTYL